MQNSNWSAVTLLQNLYIMKTYFIILIGLFALAFATSEKTTLYKTMDLGNGQYLYESSKHRTAYYFYGENRDSIENVRIYFYKVPSIK